MNTRIERFFHYMMWRFLSVLFLTALPCTVKAQTDSILVQVRTRAMGLSYSYTTTVTPAGAGSGHTVSGGISLDFDGTSRLANVNSVAVSGKAGTNEGCRFTIDRSLHQFRNVVFGNSDVKNNGLSSVGDGYQFTFDSIPFVLDSQSGIITTLGHYSGFISAWAQYSEKHANGMEQGGWSYQGYLGDSISIQVIPIPSASVIRQVVSILGISNDGPDLLRVSFPETQSPKTFLIINVLGQAMKTMPIPIGETSLQVSVFSFPRGCYFARLDNQLLKFMRE
ncbi:MAG: hypothetical protein Q8922_01820 [Bacteroidota bacterium]|nr:hypothetical protein [Bacteroidota bacterium]MDP4232035.1 hypothetical protein [Bacteroidota bacterium]MDP4241258.1 hypothetical protein [Bacteroidota bacterium]MDP4286650.1 hypothetical protein [Bacteroidota bacterium]